MNLKLSVAIQKSRSIRNEDSGLSDITLSVAIQKSRSIRNRHQCDEKVDLGGDGRDSRYALVYACRPYPVGFGDDKSARKTLSDR